MPRLLVVHHTPSPALQAMFEAAVSGSRTDQIEGVEVVVRPALTAAAVDVLEADGYRPAMAQGPAAGLRDRNSQQARSRGLLGAGCPADRRGRRLAVEAGEIEAGETYRVEEDVYLRDPPVPQRE